jgi:K+-sensing histidine kinase KdpD
MDEARSPRSAHVGDAGPRLRQQGFVRLSKEGEEIMLERTGGWQHAAWWRPACRTAAVLGPLLTCAVLANARDQVAAATSVLVLVLWVVGEAAAGDRPAAVIAAVSSGVWFDFFLTEPYLRFTISGSDDLEATVLLVLISLAVSEVALWGYRQQAQASRRSGYLEGVLGAARAVVEGETPTSALTDVVASHISEALGADGGRFVVGPVHDSRIAVLDHDGVLTRDGHAVDVDRVGLPVDEYVAVPVRRGPHTLGHFLVTASTTTAYPTREQRRIAVLLADQVAGAVQEDSA